MYMNVNKLISLKNTTSFLVSQRNASFPAAITGSSVTQSKVSGMQIHDVHHVRKR